MEEDAAHVEVAVGVSPARVFGFGLSVFVSFMVVPFGKVVAVMAVANIFGLCSATRNRTFYERSLLGILSGFLCIAQAGFRARFDILETACRDEIITEASRMNLNVVGACISRS